MRPQREIIAWREHAPWSTGMQVEQDLLLTVAMVAIFNDSFLKTQVAMRGGTVLHKVHLAPASRYSEDIDLVAVGDRPIGDIRKALLRVLRPLLGSPAVDVIADIALAIRNLIRPSKVLRLEYFYRPTESPPMRAKIKIEVNYTEREPFYGIVGLPYAPPLLDGPAAVTLQSYDLNEMLGTKMRALKQRIEGRDLFDLWWAIEQQPSVSGNALDPDKVVAAFMEYLRCEGTRVTRAEFSRDLDGKLQIGKFRTDMADKLRPGFGSYDIDVAAQIVREALLARLPA